MLLLVHLFCLRENNLRIVLCLVHDSDSNALFPEIAQALVSSVNHFETAKVFTEGKPVTFDELSKIKSKSDFSE